jgi:hypothetical protein
MNEVDSLNFIISQTANSDLYRSVINLKVCQKIIMDEHDIYTQ